MRAPLDNDTLLKYIDTICLGNRTQPMRHSNRRSSLSRLVQRCLHDVLTLAI